MSLTVSSVQVSIQRKPDGWTYCDQIPRKFVHTTRSPSPRTCASKCELLHAHGEIQSDRCQYPRCAPLSCASERFAIRLQITSQPHLDSQFGNYFRCGFWEEPVPVPRKHVIMPVPQTSGIEFDLVGIEDRFATPVNLLCATVYARVTWLEPPADRLVRYVAPMPVAEVSNSATFKPIVCTGVIVKTNPKQWHGPGILPTSR